MNIELTEEQIKSVMEDVMGDNAETSIDYLNEDVQWSISNVIIPFIKSLPDEDIVDIMFEIQKFRVDDKV